MIIFNFGMVKMAFYLSKLGEKTITSNTSISNLENFNLEIESGELKDGMTQYRFQQFF